MERRYQSSAHNLRSIRRRGQRVNMGGPGNESHGLNLDPLKPRLDRNYHKDDKDHFLSEGPQESQDE